MARILLAEDDDSLRTFLAAALRRAGHRVDTVENGSAALDEIARREFDLLIADIVMPGLDGIALARQGTRLAPRLRVMFITGFAAIVMRQRQDLFPQAQVLSKPFHLRDLVRQVDRVLATGWAGGA